MSDATLLRIGEGKLWIGAFGATEPADLTTAPGSAWTDLGYTNGGTSITIANTFTNFEVDQLLDAPGGVLTSRTIQVKSQLAEITAKNLQYALAGGVVTPGASGAPDSYVPVTAPGEPTYWALLFDSTHARVVVRKAVSDASVDLAFQKNGQTIIPVTFTAYGVSPTTAPFSAILSSPAA